MGSASRHAMESRGQGGRVAPIAKPELAPLIATTPGKAASATRPPPLSARRPSANSMNAASLRATNLG
jgi:hypothetical protein